MKLPKKLQVKKTDSVELKKVKKTLNELLEFHYQFHKQSKDQKYLVGSGGCKLSKKYQVDLFQRIMGGSGASVGCQCCVSKGHGWAGGLGGGRLAGGPVGGGGGC